MFPGFFPALSGLPQGDPAPGGVHSAESWEMGIMSPHLPKKRIFPGKIAARGSHNALRVISQLDQRYRGISAPLGSVTTPVSAPEDSILAGVKEW